MLKKFNYVTLTIAMATLAAGSAYAAGGHAPELPTIIHSLNQAELADGSKFGDTGIGHILHYIERPLIMIFVVTVVSLILFRTAGNLAMRPGKFQTVCEIFADGLSNFLASILGEGNKKFVPFFCSLFLFIWVNNLMAIVPMFGPATAKFPVALTLGLYVFCYFIYHGIKEGGLGHFLWHMAGSPQNAIGWAVSPLMFVLELVGNIAKPISLSLRLFGNLMGEDILLGVFLMLGVLLASSFWVDPLVGVPLHFPFLFLVTLGSTIQAFVFTLLSTIYLAMVLPHHDHEEHHDEEHSEAIVHQEGSKAPVPA